MRTAAWPGLLSTRRLLRYSLQGSEPPRQAMTVDVFIISWTGQHDNARSIAQSIGSLVDRVTVIYSDRDDLKRSGSGDWVQVPDDWFYGRKFKAILDRSKGSILLQITADVSCQNWPELVRRMTQQFGEMDVGVWSPLISFSGNGLKKVSIGPVHDGTTHLVTATDSIVWAMRADVAEHMRRSTTFATTSAGGSTLPPRCTATLRESWCSWIRAARWSIPRAEATTTSRLASSAGHSSASCHCASRCSAST